MQIPIKISILGGLLIAASTASAGLVYDAAILAPAQGFGTAPRVLTLQGSGTTESGGVGVAPGGGIVVGSTIGDAGVFQGNGISNQSGTGDLVNPLSDNQKYGIPTAGSLGITSANQIAILFNATEPAGNSVNVIDVTLKLYTGAGVLLGAIDGGFNFLSSNPGNGVAGFAFVVDAAQQAQVNTWLTAGGAGTIFALEATVADVAGGPESFLIYNTTAQPPVNVPTPATAALLGLGLLALARRKPNKA